MSIQFIQLDNH